MSNKKYDDDDIQRLGGVIAENLASEFKTGFEAIEEIKRQVSKIPQIQENTDTLLRDSKVVKAAIKDLSALVRIHENRIAKLESV